MARSSKTQPAPARTGGRSSTRRCALSALPQAKLHCQQTYCKVGSKSPRRSPPAHSPPQGAPERGMDLPGTSLGPHVCMVSGPPRRPLTSRQGGPAKCGELEGASLSLRARNIPPPVATPSRAGARSSRAETPADFARRRDPEPAGPGRPRRPARGQELGPCKASSEQTPRAVLRHFKERMGAAG